MTYAEKLKDPRWQKRRLEVLSSTDFTCDWCGETHKTLHVHHFCYEAGRNPWDSPDTDLAPLCEDCHFIEHYKQFTPLEKELIDDIGILLSLKDKELLRRMNAIIISHIKNKKQHG